MYGIINIYILRRDRLLFDVAGKDRAQRTRRRKAEGPGTDQKKQLAGKVAVFPSGCVVSVLTALARTQQENMGRRKAEVHLGMKTQDNGQPGQTQKAGKAEI